MTTTLEKAARAAHEEQRGAGFDLYDSCGFLEQQKWRDIARAVLMAVREPDDKMQDAGGRIAEDEALAWGGKHPIDPGSVGLAFTAMIDAILNEQDQST